MEWGLCVTKWLENGPTDLKNSFALRSSRAATCLCGIIVAKNSPRKLEIREHKFDILCTDFPWPTPKLTRIELQKLIRSKLDWRTIGSSWI